jgi:hypothetical protein
MTQTWFDTVILGDSLAGRVAGALLARRGARVLCLRPSGELKPPNWFLSSLVLERLLEQLEGGSVLTRPQRFQYLADPVRLDFHGRTTLTEELRREYAENAGQTESVLDDFTDFGNKLSELLWDTGGLPFAGARARLRFSARCLRRGLGGKRLDQPLEERLGSLAPTAAAGLLGGLLPALALIPADRLTVAEAALLWHGAMRPRGVSFAGLDELLLRRFRQFHGEEDDLGRLESIEGGGRQPLRLVMKNGRPVAAGNLLLADEAPTGTPLQPTVEIPATVPHTASVTIEIGDLLSPMLADHVALGDSHPLRLSLAGSPGDRRAVVEWAGSWKQPDLTDRLRQVMPFVDVDLELPEAGAQDYPAPGLTAAAKRAAAGKNILWCGPMVLPALGTIGEVLTGFSAASTLLAEEKSSD